MPKVVSALGFFELGRKMKEIENMIDAADSHKSSDSMDEEVLGQLCLDLWDFINDPERVIIRVKSDGFYAGLRERVIEALRKQGRVVKRAGG